MTSLISKLIPERSTFYIQNADDYVRLLKRNYEYYGVTFKHPKVEELPPYPKFNTCVENHIDNLDQIKVEISVLKTGKVRVKILPHMAILNEKYYSKYKVPPIKSVSAALKAHGYSQEFIESMMTKYKKRNELIEKRWKIIEKRFDAPSTASANKTKKAKKKADAEAEAEAEAETVPDVDDDEPDEDDENDPEEDEAIVVDDEDDEVVEDEYVSDGGED
jgi:hypothetical protein